MGSGMSLQESYGVPTGTGLPEVASNALTFPDGANMKRHAANMASRFPRVMYTSDLGLYRNLAHTLTLCMRFPSCLVTFQPGPSGGNVHLLP